MGSVCVCEPSPQIDDLTDLLPQLGQAATLADLVPVARGIVEAMLAADVHVVGSPVCKGSYTALFEQVFDLIDPAAIMGKPVLLAAAGGGGRHALIIERQMRPLFGFFERATRPTGVHAGASDLADGRQAGPKLPERNERAAEQISPWNAPPRSIIDA